MVSLSKLLNELLLIDLYIYLEVFNIYIPCFIRINQIVLIKEELPLFHVPISYNTIADMDRLQYATSSIPILK